MMSLSPLPSLAFLRPSIISQYITPKAGRDHRLPDNCFEAITSQNVPVVPLVKQIIARSSGAGG